MDVLEDNDVGKLQSVLDNPQAFINTHLLDLDISTAVDQHSCHRLPRHHLDTTTTRGLLKLQNQ